MDETWTIAELAERATAALAGLAPANGRVSDVPNERLIRYYTTIGLLDPPLARRGRVALYGRRHLLQLVAVKRRQAEGASNAAIQRELLGATDDHLAELAGGRVPTLTTQDARPATGAADTARLPGDGSIPGPVDTGKPVGNGSAGTGDSRQAVGSDPAPGTANSGNPGRNEPAPGTMNSGNPARNGPAIGAGESGGPVGRPLRRAVDADTKPALAESRPRFWATPTLPAPPRPVFPPVFHGVSLTPEAALLLSRPLTDDERAAVTLAAQPLIDLLTDLGFTEGIPS
ncbi:helix-turn-helix domain-containing protein [Herbidospora cretacea]|uniref:helix-turn-helix domain-containing protein n=1 Tax=Herbidospora cretacea TaxID=28444 RepID=UPI000A436842|nr:MerR family transcriptional regulator [Herbidospora cretacea]